MNCKGCGKNISGNEYKKVADWTFCPGCFDDLMHRSEQKPETAKSPGSDPRTKDTCRICDVEIDKGQGKKLGIWTLCQTCHDDMTFRPKEKPVPEGTEETPEDTEEERSEDTAGERIKTNRTIACSGCGRSILAVAAKEDQDNFYCPDCFYKKTEK
jgi:hypothetical protein